MKIKILLLLAAIGVLFSFARPVHRSRETKPAKAEILPAPERELLQPFALEDKDQFN